MLGRLATAELCPVSVLRAARRGAQKAPMRPCQRPSPVETSGQAMATRIDFSPCSSFGKRTLKTLSARIKEIKVLLLNL